MGLRRWVDVYGYRVYASLRSINVVMHRAPASPVFCRFETRTRVSFTRGCFAIFPNLVEIDAIDPSLPRRQERERERGTLDARKLRILARDYAFASSVRRANVEFAGRKITQVDRTRISTVIFGAYVHQHVVAVDRAGRSGDTDSGYANAETRERRRRG